MVRLPRLLRHESAGGMYPVRGSSSGGAVPWRRTSPPGENGRSGQINVQSSNYWSATTNANNTSNAWDVNFNNGDVDNDDKTNTNHVWCVRGGA